MAHLSRSGRKEMVMINIDFSDKIRKIRNELPSAEESLKDELIANPFFKDFVYSFCWSSNAIEGNTLSLEETISLLEFDEVSTGHTYSEYTEAKRLNVAIKKYLSFEPQEITECWIKNVANEITGLGAEYRTSNVYIGTLSEAVYYPPDYERINGLMNDYVRHLQPYDRLSFGEKIACIAEKHIEFERIHPFADGNGRTGRLILNQLLINEGLLPIIIEPKSKYRSAFKVYDKNRDTSIMENIIYNGLLNSLEKIDVLNKKKEAVLGKTSCKVSEQEPEL